MYKCSNCEYNSKSYFGLCPRCKTGIGEEHDEPVNSGRKVIPIQIKRFQFSKINHDFERDKIVKNTIFKTFDRVLSQGSGFVEDQVIALGAQAGVGKSTLISQIADEEALYISTEESLSQLNARFVRVNPGYKGDLLSETDLETILHAIEISDKKMILIDSLNNINNGLEGYVRQAQNMSRIVDLIKQNKKYGIIVSHVAKGGEITGMNTILHAVDTVMYLERSLVSSNLILSSNKNRFGEIGSIAMFEHTQKGLSEIFEVDENPDPEIGTTYARAKFGYKSFKIGIEALVAPSSLNYGLRRVNGLNQNRVQQILGILAVNSNNKLNFTNKDVYVSVSNGLTSMDTNLDLAIANSLLSSYYNVEPKRVEIAGEIGLNGKIRNGDLKHIKELLREYNVWR